MITKNNSQKQPSLWRWLLIVLVVSIVISVFYNWLSVRSEHRNRLLFAEELLKDDDTEALLIFEELHQQIRLDSIDFFENDLVSLMFCEANEKLLLEDEETIVDCYAFFWEKMKLNGRPTANENLFEIRRNPFDVTYVGVIKTSENQNIYVEFAFKENAVWLQNTLKKNRYSVAYYEHSGLIKQIGAFEYPLVLPKANILSNKTFFEYEKYSHLCIFIGDFGNEYVLLVSKRIPRFQNRLSIFSVIFILNLCLGLLVLLIWKRAFRLLFKTFTQRLQLTVLGIVLSIFVLVGVTSVIYVQRLNSQKNQKILREKTHSLLLLMELRFGNKTPNEILENSTLLLRKLNEFSEVIFTDVFLYDPMGHLVATSALDDIFQGSVKDTMNPQALHQLSNEHRNFYIQKETLDGHTFYSSYVPFRNNRNELVGYLNLPHFAKQTELRQEISAFILAYINLFVVLIIVAFIVVFFVIKRLTKPLIESERQIAWNEMAKQIAHEIKNPLTPMKLNVQQIQKAWNDQKEDFNDRMKHFSTVMIEQIDTLSTIASEFSTFAQQPNVKLTEVNVKECLGKVILLMNTDNIIQFEIAENIDNTTILADEKQLSRALVNILKNAKQAVSELENPQIKVSLSTSENSVLIAIQNNGNGIPTEIRGRIFEPNFTTKTSGTGLGLAITKNIIERFFGTISFETNETKTVFYIQLPKSEQLDG
ncbi:MAG: GHKL domain-containing protein [Bacteroidales bacterium]|jgi:signal transduction histidine kinase|nr:GHKL domain-containing protein [Bacteroidales bacterium]